jgi:hypothetical protein
MDTNVCRNKWWWLLAVAGLMVFPGIAAADPKGEEIVKQADLVRGPAQPFTLKMNVTDYKGTEKKGQTGVFVNIFDATRSLIEVMFPKKDAGRKILRAGENMWIHIPSSKRAIRITPQQRLLGQASNGDVLGTNYGGDYTAKFLNEEEIERHGGTRARCNKLELIKKTNAATYDRILYWVEVGTNFPTKAEFYTRTGKLIKIAYFTDYKDALGAKRPVRTILVNALEKNSYTVVDVVEYGSSSLPESAYNENQLSR